MDAVKLILVFLAFIVPWAIAGLWWWVGFWLAIAAVLGISELASYIITKKTISQQFWVWLKTAQTSQKIAIILGMILFWGYLICHLFFKW